MNKNCIAVGLIAGLMALSAAAYDPAPDSSIVLAQGEWHGELTYDDYSNPGTRVSIPARMFAALSAPATLAVQFTFDDGPGKTVYSYESLAFDFESGTASWRSGIDEPVLLSAKITANSVEDGVRTIVLERLDEQQRIRYTLQVSEQTLSLSTHEVTESGEESFRNRYQLKRSQ